MVNLEGLIQDPSSYAEAMERLSKVDDLIVDVETTGLKLYHGDRICGVAIDGGEAGAFYFPFRHQGEGAPGNLPLEYLRRDIAKLITDPKKTVTTWHGKFDVQAFAVDGVPFPPDGSLKDVMLAAHLMNENEYRYDDQGRVMMKDGKPMTDFRLKVLADRYLGSQSSKEEKKLIELLRSHGFGKQDMWRLPAHLVAPYAIGDVRLTRGLRDFYVPHLRTWRLYDLWEEVNVYNVITALMEYEGMLIDRDLVHQYMEEADRMIEPTLKELQELAGYPINPASPRQLQAWLGEPTTSREHLEEVLQALEESGQADHPKAKAIQTLLDYRGWSKVNGTYYRPYLELADANGVIHPNLSLVGTVSGRLSCYEPNLQAVPRYSKVYKVKDVFVSRPGMVMVSADYSQAEIRWGTHYANEVRMAEVLKSGADIHQSTADMLNIPRDYAKRINFGIVYGIGKRSLAQKLKISETQAAEILNRYHTLYPGFRSLYRRAEQVATERGYIRMFTGRVRRYDHLNPTHKASSNLIQGSVAEMMRIAITRIHRDLRSEGVHMLMQIHDQIISEVPEDKVDVLVPEIVRRMCDFDLLVPIEVDVKVGRSWGKLKPWEGKMV